MATLILAVLLCMGWLWPDHFVPWIAFHNEAPVFAGLLIALIACLWKLGRPNVNVPVASLLIAGWMLVPLAQYGLGLIDFVGDLALTWLYLGGFGLAWWLGFTLADEKRPTRGLDTFETMLVAFAAGATVSALICLIQWFELEPLWSSWVMSAAHTPRAIANLAQPNQLATLLLMGIVATAILYDVGRLNVLLAVLLVSLQTLALIGTQSRTGVLAVVALSILVWAARSVWQRLCVRDVVSWAFLFGAFTWLYQFAGKDAVKGALGEQVLQVGLRPLLWGQFAAAISEAPWFGYGWLQTAKAHAQGAMQMQGIEQASYTHNLLLDLAVWQGVPLTILLVMPALYLIWRRRKGLQHQLCIKGLLLLLPVFFHCMLEFPHAYAYFLFPAGVILGLVDYWSSPKQWSSTSSIAVWLWAIPIALWGALAVVAAVEYVQAEEDFRVARFENRSLGTTPAEYQLPKLWLLDQLGTLLKAMRVRAEPHMAVEDMQSVALASKKYFWIALQYKHAVALGLNQQPEEAARQMRKIKALYGEKLYAQIRQEYLRLQQEKYPELNQVQLP